MKEYQHQCVEDVIPNERYGFVHKHRCMREGIVERGGKWYCKQHDPVAIEAKLKAKTAIWKAASDKRNAEYHRTNVTAKACEKIPTKALEAGVIQEMIEVCKSLDGLLFEYADSTTKKVFDSAVWQSNRILANLKEKEDV
jgi:hypothetical protein